MSVGSPLEAKVFLAQSTDVVDGRLYLHGAGMSVCSPGLTFALLVRLQLARSIAAGQHCWALDLVPRASGADPDAPAVAGFSGEFTLRATEVRAGAASRVAFSVGSCRAPRDPGRYTWRLRVDGQTDPRWSADFLQL